MTTDSHTADTRAIYQEYVHDDLYVAVLSDPSNMQAWIQSDTSVEVER